jgi:hypothetical protein
MCLITVTFIVLLNFCDIIWLISGADPGFQVRGAYLEKLRRAEGGAKNFGVFRVKNHDFMQKKILFFPILGGARSGCATPCIRP